MKNIEPDIFADVHFLATNEGGRKRPVFGATYKPSIQIGDKICPGLFLIENLGKIFPGQEVKNVPIKFLDLEFMKDEIHVGRSFKIKEDRYVGEGVVTTVINPQ